MTDPSLLTILQEKIRSDGPISVGAYMAQCLGQPQHGYYMRGDVFGTDGDFTTAPEVSQLFGEMLAIWVMLQYQQMGSPLEIQLVEIGPGRGTLMRDIWRGLSAMPDLRDRLQIHLVEFSPALQKIQRETLNGLPVTWHTDISTLPRQTSLIIGNELLDALPIEQAIWVDGVWRKRMVGLENDRLAFVTGDVLTELNITGAQEGEIYEYAPAVGDFFRQICRLLKSQGGAALLIDYGDNMPPDQRIGETLQALHKHQYVHTLLLPGASDLTAHVAFAPLLKIAEETECTAQLHEQGPFLSSLGIHLRLEKLLLQANEEQSKALQSGVQRLTAPEQMGRLFKVLEVKA